MPPRRLDTEIDQLYQLPLDEFTTARNNLARTAGTDATEIRKLAKPPIAAWAVNQLYWKQRDRYDALIEASTAVRKAHKTILGGRQADLRDPAREHEEALDAALKGILTILHEAGHPATDATRQAILTTLRALPSADTPGRLTGTLQPGGFEMLQGLSIAGGGGVIRPKPVARKEPEPIESQRKPRTAEDRADAAKVEAKRAESAKALREAEQTARREEFEAMRTTREAERSLKQLERARENFKAAQHALEQAETAAEDAERQRDVAGRRTKDAERALESARRQHDAILRGKGHH
jgi:hypothetical protein